MLGWWLSLSTRPFKPGSGAIVGPVIPGCALFARRPGIQRFGGVLDYGFAPHAQIDLVDLRERRAPE
jgi:hypothetical protein